MSMRSLVLLTAAAVAAALIAPLAGSSALRLPALKFRPHAGWQVISTGSNPKPPSAAVVLAATIPLHNDPESANTLPPNWALHALPARGIIVQATNYGRFQLKDHPQRRLPLTILHAHLLHGFEGVPRRYGYIKVPAQVHGWAIEVYAWFGQAHPTRTQLLKADREVHRLVFPP